MTPVEEALAALLRVDTSQMWPSDAAAIERAISVLNEQRSIEIRSRTRGGRS